MNDYDPFDQPDEDYIEWAKAEIEWMGELQQEILNVNDETMEEVRLRISKDEKAENFFNQNYNEIAMHFPIKYNKEEEGYRMIISIENDDVEALRDIFVSPEFDVLVAEKYYLLDVAAKCSAIKCFMFLTLQGFEYSGIGAHCAIEGGNIEIIRLSYNSGVDFQGCIQVADQYLRFDIIEWIINTYGYPLKVDTYASAGKCYSAIKLYDNNMISVCAACDVNSPFFRYYFLMSDRKCLISHETSIISRFAAANNVTMLKYLISRGADPSMTDQIYHCDPIISVATSGAEDAFFYLAQFKENPNMFKYYSFTTLMGALSSKSKPIIRYLFKFPIKVGIEDWYGLCDTELVEMWGDPEVTKLFNEALEKQKKQESSEASTDELS